jgi:hypothetical protein
LTAHKQSQPNGKDPSGWLAMLFYCENAQQGRFLFVLIAVFS